MSLRKFNLRLLAGPFDQGFRRWWQLWMKTTTIKQSYWMNLFFIVFRSFVLLPNSMSKLIHNWCTRKLIIKTTAAYVYAHEQLSLVFLCCSRLFCSPWYSPLSIILKQLFASGSVNVGEYSLRLRLDEYSPMFTSPSANNCWICGTSVVQQCLPKSVLRQSSKVHEYSVKRKTWKFMGFVEVVTKCSTPRKLRDN